MQATAVWKRLALPALIAALAAVTVFAQMRADAVKPQRKDELVYLPNEKLLNHFTAGMSSVIADLLWLRCVQYTGVEIKESHNFAWLTQMLNTIVRMDPNFTDVYRYGGIFLAAVKADDNAGLELLQRGIVARPDQWTLPYEAAMIYLLNRRDEPASKRLAAMYLAMAVSTGKAPKLVVDLAASLQGDLNLDDIESDMWSDLEKSDDAMLRELAARKQQELLIRKNLRTLDDNIARFQAEVGRTPATFDELIDAGYFGEAMKAPEKRAALTKDPLGGNYFIAEDSTARSTTLLDDERDKVLNRYRDFIKKYKEDMGSNPPSLDAVVEKYLEKPFPHPYPSRSWQYDPATGEISG